MATGRLHGDNALHTGAARDLPPHDLVFIPAFPPLATGRPHRGGRRRPWRTNDVFPGARLFARGRFALFEGLRVLAEIRGVRRLWVPAYLCRPVVDVARAVGLEVALYDVDGRLEPRWTTVAPMRGDALLALHYFGLALPRRPLQDFCSAHDMPLVEDCAHAVPDPGAAVQVGYAGALAIFSLRKQAPVPGGGLLVVNDPDLRPAVREPARCGIGDRRTLVKLAIMLAERLAFGLGYNVLPYKDRLPVPDAQPEPGAGPSPRAPVAAPAEYSRPPAPAFLLRPMLARLDWRAQIRTRQVAYRRLAARLRATPGVTLPVITPAPGSVPQAMPIWVADPDGTARRLRARGVEAMCWPGQEQVPFQRDACPGTVAWLDRSLLLPLGCALTPPLLDAMVEAVHAAAGVHAIASAHHRAVSR
jgi:dTDP-4-amino-4,6-dideoxygalactose transaminase